MPGAPAQPPARPPKPDPRPGRIGIGAGALAVLSILTVALVPVPAAEPVEDDLADDLAAVPAREVRVETRVRYVRLKRGETPPPGARTIPAAAPTPRVIVTRISAPAPAREQRSAGRTRQSGG